MKNLSDLAGSNKSNWFGRAIRLGSLVAVAVVLSACTNFAHIKPASGTGTVTAQNLPVIVGPTLPPTTVVPATIDEKGNATSLTALPKG